MSAEADPACAAPKPEPELYDLSGLKCPWPVLKTGKRLAKMPDRSELVVLTTDPLAGIDIPHFCAQNGHELLGQEKTARGHRFHIRKSETESPRGLASRQR